MGMGYETHNKFLEHKQITPEHNIFLFFYYPEKLGGFIRFHRKRFTSCDALELNQISDAYETPSDTDLTARHIL